MSIMKQSMFSCKISSCFFYVKFVWSADCWGCSRCWFISCRCCRRGKTCIWGCWYNGSCTFCLHIAWASNIGSFGSKANGAWPWNCKFEPHLLLYFYITVLAYMDIVGSFCALMFLFYISENCKSVITNIYLFPAWGAWCCCCWAPASWCSGWTCS